MRRLVLLLAPLMLGTGCATIPGRAPPHPAATAALPMQDCPPQREYPFRDLVFQGGGVKGIAYGGALEVLEQQGILPKVQRVAGTSAGSIAALFVALRYSPEEIRNELLELDFKRFEDGCCLGGVFRVFNRFGYYKGDFALQWLRSRVREKAVNPSATFRELRDKGFRDLHVVASDLSRRQSKVFSFDTSPDMEVALAVRMSMSIPLFFAAVRDADGNVFVDGGLFMNYPIVLFDGDQPNPVTIGLSLSSTNAPPTNVKIDNLDQYAKGLFESLLAVQTDLLANSKPDLVRTVIINDLGIPATDFELTDAQKDQLLQQGAIGTCKYLRGWRPEALQETIRAP